jgi:hypothetical protein
MPPEAKFENPSTTLPPRTRDVITLFEQEVARCNGHAMTPGSFVFVGMMEWDPKSIYDLLSMTLGNTDSESDSEGSHHSLRECNMLHLSEDVAAVAGGMEDDAYPIPCTPEEQAKYDQECLEQARPRETKQADEHHDDRCPSPQHLDVEGIRARAHCIYD